MDSDRLGVVAGLLRYFYNGVGQVAVRNRIHFLGSCRNEAVVKGCQDIP